MESTQRFVLLKIIGNESSISQHRSQQALDTQSLHKARIFGRIHQPIHNFSPNARRLAEGLHLLCARDTKQRRLSSFSY
jgi:hypothetical protein